MASDGSDDEGTVGPDHSSLNFVKNLHITTAIGEGWYEPSRRGAMDLNYGYMSMA